MLVYALHHGCSEEIDDEIAKCLLNNDKIDLNVNVIYTNTHYNTAWCSIVELGIQNKRIDVAKQLVMAGANPIHPSLDNISGVAQILEEYYEFGTNEYMYWLLHQYLLPRDLPEIIKTVVNLDIFNENGVIMFTEVGRHPAHAVLTCGHEKMVRQFLETHGTHMLYVKDTTGRTALQISAQKGDFESVNTLLKM